MISVIVPVFKVERYLQRCVDSILNQSFADFELILVDDGSPDRCGEICDKYAQQDERICVVHKENGGLSSARNAGIAVARGEYLCFVDSDDWVDRDYLHVLHQLITENDAEMSACRFCKAVEGKAVPENMMTAESEIIRNRLMLCAITDDSYSGFACNKLFRADIIRERAISFDEKIFNGEDLPFVVEYLQHCKSVADTKAELYFYNIRPQSITTTKEFSEKSFSILYAREKVLQVLMENEPESIDIELAAYLFHLIKIKYLLEPKKEEWKEHYAAVCKKINKLKGKVCSLRGVPISTKLKLMIMIKADHLVGEYYRNRYENS